MSHRIAYNRKSDALSASPSDPLVRAMKKPALNKLAFFVSTPKEGGTGSPSLLTQSLQNNETSQSSNTQMGPRSGKSRKSCQGVIVVGSIHLGTPEIASDRCGDKTLTGEPQSRGVRNSQPNNQNSGFSSSLTSRSVEKSNRTCCRVQSGSPIIYR